MLIQINNMSKTYGSKETLVDALKCVNLAIDRGEFTAILGPSGCGKSTLLHILGAMDTPGSGEIILEGNNLQKLSNRKLSDFRLKRIGFIFQTFNLIPTLTALQNVMLPMKLSGTPGNTARERSLQLLERMGLKDRSRHYPAQLSGGQKQRVAVARALANNPAIILADEPTGNLDSVNGEKIMDLFGELSNDGNTILLVTHNPELAKKTSRILYMKDGRFINS